MFECFLPHSAIIIHLIDGDDGKTETRIFFMIYFQLRHKQTTVRPSRYNVVCHTPPGIMEYLKACPPVPVSVYHVSMYHVVVLNQKHNQHKLYPPSPVPK